MCHVYFELISCYGGFPYTTAGERISPGAVWWNCFGIFSYMNLDTEAFTNFSMLHIFCVVSKVKIGENFRRI